MGATGVICDDELSPAQLRNLESALDTKGMDRTMVILDIFAAHWRRRARGKSRLSWHSCVILRSAPGRSAQFPVPSGAAVSVREDRVKKLEMDRRLIHERIGQLKSELEDVKRHREVNEKTARPEIYAVGGDRRLHECR